MFATIDAFVMWLVKQPSVPFWVGYIGIAVFMRIWDALKSPGVFDDRQEESKDSPMTKNYRLIAIRRFCSRIACGRLSLLYAQAVCSSGK